MSQDDITTVIVPPANTGDNQLGIIIYYNALVLVSIIYELDCLMQMFLQSSGNNYQTT